MDLKEINVGHNETDVDPNSGEKRGADILYGIDDIPPWYLSIPMAFQVREPEIRTTNELNYVLGIK